jgi:calcium-independent phospholipase A2
MLSNANKLVTQDMKFGGTPLHWSSSREVVGALIESGCDVNTLNFEGQTALHVMVTRNRLDCVVELLSHEAEVDVRDKSGNTPLHLAVEKKLIPMVQCLVVFGCDINMKNKDEKTPRHIVGKDASGGNDDMILYILHSVGAKRCSKSMTKCPPGCNHEGDYNGIPPAQPESMEKRDHIQHVLESTSRGQRGSLAGNLINSMCNEIRDSHNASNKHKEDVANMAVDVKEERKGASVMDAILSMFTSTRVVKMEGAAGQDPESPTTSEKSKSEGSDRQPMDTTASPTPVSEFGRGRVLCLDGGGIRGLVLTQLLLEIENLAQSPISHLFDWVAGTSTGGILALALGCGKTMKQCMCLYLRMKEQAFVGSRPYISDPLEAVLKDSVGEFTVMSDIKHPKLMVAAVMADRKPVDLHLFRNYECASEILDIKTPTSEWELENF